MEGFRYDRGCAERGASLFLSVMFLNLFALMASSWNENSFPLLLHRISQLERESYPIIFAVEKKKRSNNLINKLNYEDS